MSHMTEKIQVKDFLELEYTGKLKEGNAIFDTTDKKVAEEAGIAEKNRVYEPTIICIGEGHLLKGLDEALQGKEVGKKYTIELKPEDAFGRKNMKLIQLVATNKFKQQGIQPMPGLQVNIDGLFGTIKSVSGGRTLVDFNHPLAGQELVYEVTVTRKVMGDQEKVQALAKLLLQQEATVELKESKAIVTVKKAVQDQGKERLQKKVRELVQGVKDLTVTVSGN